MCPMNELEVHKFHTDVVQAKQNLPSIINVAVRLSIMCKTIKIKKCLNSSPEEDLGSFCVSSWLNSWSRSPVSSNGQLIFLSALLRFSPSPSVLRHTGPCATFRPLHPSNFLRKPQNMHMNLLLTIHPHKLLQRLVGASSQVKSTNAVMKDRHFSCDVQLSTPECILRAFWVSFKVNLASLQNSHPRNYSITNIIPPAPGKTNETTHSWITDI